MSWASKPYIAGDHLALCDICGRKLYGSDLRKNWQGLMVCDRDYEERHPQDTIEVKRERIAVRDPRPQGQDINFLEPGDVTEDNL